MDKPKRSTGFLNRLNLQRRKQFEFVAPLSLEECQGRLLAINEHEIRYFMSRYKPFHAKIAKNQHGDTQIRIERKQGSTSPTISLNAALMPLSLHQTRVNGEVYLNREAIFTLWLITSLSVVLLPFVVTAVHVLGVIVPSLILFMWLDFLRYRNQLLKTFMETLDVKIKRKAKNLSDAEAE